MEKMNLTESQDSALREFFENMAEYLRDHETYVLGDGIETVEHRGRDGFLPFTNGGYNVTATDSLGFVFGRGASATEDKYLLEYYERGVNEAAMQFIMDRDELAELRDHEDVSWSSDNNIDVLFLWFDAREAEHDARYGAQSPQLPNMPDAPRFWQTDAGRLREAFFDFENEWHHEGGEFFWVCRAQFYAADNHRNDSGQDEVFLFFAINTDFSYGRYKANEILASINLAPESLTPENLEFVAEWFQGAMEDCDNNPMPAELDALILDKKVSTFN